MNKANYLNPAFDRYPLSMESFDFIQEQINLLQHICELYDMNYILRKPTGEADGIIVIKGEVMPLWKGAERDYITVETKPIDVDADGVSYKEVRTERYAIYTSSRIGTESYSSSDFKVITKIADIKTDLESTKSSLTTTQAALTTTQTNLGTVTDRVDKIETNFNKHMPKGAIIMWSGAISDINTEYFRLCDGNNGNKVNDLIIPDLRGRFVVGYDSRKDKIPINAITKDQYNYGEIGNTGGKDQVQLSNDELLSHNHVKEANYNKLSTVAGNSTLGLYSGIPSVVPTNAISTIPLTDRSTKYKVGAMSLADWNDATIQIVGKGFAHENRPPYYVLAYLIKII